MTPNSILQWNINGYRAKNLALLNILQEYSPKVIALQETKVDSDVYMKIKGFDNIYRKDRDNHGGGVCIAIHNSIPSQAIKVNTNLEIVACRVMFKNYKLTVCNVYFNNNADITYDALNIIKSLPTPILVLGDVNAKHPVWGSNQSDTRGTVINDWVLDNEFFIINDGSPTRYCIGSNTYSHIDISMTNISQSNKFKWQTITNRLVSDHFPILIDHEFEGLYKSKLPRWIMEKADWNGYRDNTNIPLDISHVNNPCETITSILKNSATEHIPKSSSIINTKYSNCWWDENCSEATHNAKKQFNKIKRVSTPDDVEAYLELEEIVKTTLLNAKSESWNKYVATITRTTSIKEIWNKINSISGKSNNRSKIMLELNNESIGDPCIIVEEFGQFFSFTNSNDNYSQEFLNIKQQKEAVDIVFNNKETWYNAPITMGELETALETCTGSTPGLDDLHYDMFKELNLSQKQAILNFYNYLYLNDLFPDSWRIAIVIPILKVGKNPYICTSYRPISLTSCFCKLMEKIINRRLIMYLDRNNILQPYQSGARKFHSTYDSLVRFESAIREGLINSKYIVAVYFDIEKAFDMLWVHGLMELLKSIGLDGHLPAFIQNFLKNRRIRVRLGDVLSDEFLLENGTPQGSILSPILFMLIINSMFNNTPDIAKSLFFDDGLAWAVGDNLESTMDKIQKALDTISNWGPKIGIKFSIAKTKYMIFARRDIKLSKDDGSSLELKFYGESIDRVYRYKYLGLIFDPWLTWGPHIKYLAERCQKPLSIMQCVANKNWGADRKSLANLYLASVQSKINYGDFIYGSARKSNLEILDKIQYRALRIISGNIKTTAVYNLEPEVNILPLAYKRKLNGLKYMGRIYRIEGHPTKQCYLDFNNRMDYDLRNRKGAFPLPMVGRMKNLAKNLKLPISKIENIDFKNANICSKIKFPFTLKGANKNDPYKCKQEFLNIKNSKYKKYTKFYSDGSKINNRTGCAYVVNGKTYSARLTRYSSVFTAEQYALFLILKHISRSKKTKFVIFCDSLSALESIKNNKNKNSLNIKISQLLNTISNKEIVFEWIPSHIGIYGNELADKAAKESTKNRFIRRLPLNIDEYNSIVKKRIFQQWQTKWNNTWKNSNNPCNLYKAKPTLGDWKSSYRENRREEVVLSRLRTGWCRYLVQQYYQNQNYVPKHFCNQCMTTNTIEHILLTCPKWGAFRISIYYHIRRLKLPISLETILGEQFNHNILFKYLKDIKFYDIV